MKISRRVTPAGLAGVLGLTGLGVAAVGVPLAVAEDNSTTAEYAAHDADDREQAIRDALADLVADGTITEDQADAVAAALDDSDALRPGLPGGPFGPGGRAMVPLDLDAAADALGMTTDELWDALSADGATLADIAEDQGVDSDTLVDALVAAAEERLEQAVTDGRLTQEQADELMETVPERVAAAIEREFPAHRWRGPDRGRHHGGDDEATENAPAEESSAVEQASPV
jgi:hypothetical protein